jgi:hypothetical protein
MFAFALAGTGGRTLMSRSPLNTFTLARRESLSGGDVAAMFQLIATHFNGVTHEQFTRDLTQKNWVVRIWQGDELVGFTTLHVYESEFMGDPVSVVYSGDTIVAPAAWGSTALARGWIAAVNELRSYYPKGKYYWLLLSSGFRTYRFLPVFWKQFFPCHAHPMPGPVRALRDHLALARFGNQYNPARGIVRFQQPQQLRGPLHGIPDGRLTDPHVAFFATENPGHDSGDELVCLTELCEANLTAAGRRMVRPQSDV